MLEIVLPDNDMSAMTERLGAAFLPEGWKNVPSAFTHVYYFVAPPSKLQPGQHDLVREIRQGGGGAFDEVLSGKGHSASSRAAEKAIDDDRKYYKDMPEFAFDKHVAPWKMVSTIQLVVCINWVFLICGTMVDVIIGDQGLVTAPHWSRPPMTRQSYKPHELGTPLGFPWAAGDKPFLPEQMAWHEEKRHADEFNLGSRRLQGIAARSPSFDLSTAIADLLDAMPSAEQLTAASLATRASAVTWPEFFEPRLLACGPVHDEKSSLVAALTPRGFGTVTRVGHGVAEVASAFKLAGITGLPPLVGASWSADQADGLTLVSRAGHLVACPGRAPSAGGVWKCGAGQRLPLEEGEQLLAAATAVLPGVGGTGGMSTMHAAVVHASVPDVVAIFVQEGEAWVPLGEVSVPRGQSRRAAGPPSLAFVDGDLLVTTATGQLLRRRLRDGLVVASAVHGLGGESWRAACGLLHNPEGGIAHLRLRRSSSAAFEPELITTSVPLHLGTELASGAGGPFFQ